MIVKSGLIACKRANTIHIDVPARRVAKMGIEHKMVFLAALIVAGGSTKE